MMRKKIVSLCMALVLCLSLLPATALAAENDRPYSLYVGNTDVAKTEYSDNAAYWTSSDGGTNWTSQLDEPTADSYIHYDGNGTLTLHNVNISRSNENGIYAEAMSGSAVSLTIKLEGTNTVSGWSGIFVHTVYGAASLSISGTGSLTAEGTGGGSFSGIQVQSNDGKAELTINNVDVTATNNVAQGIILRSGGSSTASLTVNGGELTASGSDAGIKYVFGSSGTGDGTPTVTVSDNAIVRANGGISDDSSTDIQIGADSNESNGGIVFDGKNGTVYGDVTLQENLTIGKGESLNIPSGASLTIPEGTTLTVNGGELTGENIPTEGVVYKVTEVKLDKDSLSLEVGGTATLTATITPSNATDQNVTWSSNAPGVATVDSSGNVTAVAPGTATITVTTEDGNKTATCVVTVTAATVPVTGVTLSQNQASLYYNRTPNTLTLTATVAPANATNQNVTWASSDPSVATVDAAGKVTAVGAGTATITVTTVDGGKTAACTVTVRPDIPPANPNYRITVEATQGGTVTADPTAAKAGATVTLTPVPDRGYQVGSVAVTDRFGDAVAVTEQADGTYTFTMPNGQVTVTVTFAEAPLPFPDVAEGDWFYDAVRYAYENSLMDGVGDNLFAPNSQTTRAQLVTILYRLAGQPAVSGDLPFPDVESGTWYTDAVVWAAENGIVNGVSDTEFAPGDDITREQLAAILYRYAACQGYDVSQRADLSGFGDASSISGYAQEALSWAHAQGLVLGFEDGSLRPQGTASRAQIAAVLMRFLAAVSAE